MRAPRAARQIGAAHAQLCQKIETSRADVHQSQRNHERNQVCDIELRNEI
jgi:hypothetical protein